jgi:starch phosphorylase
MLKNNEQHLPLDDSSRRIAYFSMEVGLDVRMPTYAGGLGVLAGDTIRAAADFSVPLIALTLLHRKGYFYQHLNSDGWQTEEPVDWVVNDFLNEMSPRIVVNIEERKVYLRAWKYEVIGVGNYKIPVYFLDANLPENSEWDRTLTDLLYGGDDRYRFCQEVILGIGGVRMLRALGYKTLERFHMNEGHSSLLTLELLDESVRKAGRDRITQEDITLVQRQCVFTTHTPVPVAHDKFSMELVIRVLGRNEVSEMQDVFCCDGVLNMTFLALNLSHYINGVAKRHGELSQLMFGHYFVDAITNGVHAATWVAQPFAKLFDHYIPGWKQDNFSLRYALGIPKEEIWNAHMQAKAELILYANRETNGGLDVNILTLGFARRATAYKRADLLFTDIERLKNIATKAGSFQIIFAGKAHPNDHEGKEIIHRIFQLKEILHKEIRIIYLEHHDIDLSKLMTAGSDVWLNTPEPPMEASGTSGMKAALNGVPSLSVLDGWWLEGYIDGITGWSIGEKHRSLDMSPNRAQDAASLYDKLEYTVIPTFYGQRQRYLEIMRHSIALNGSFFNTHRMIQQYVLKAYFE